MTRTVSRALGALALCLAVPATASAQTFELFGPDPSRSRYETPQNFSLELRFSPWQPEVDGEVTRNGPFLAYFGESDGNGQRRVSDRLLSGLELDWQALRINPLGSLGIGVGVMYSTFTATAPITATGASSGQESSLNLLPMYGTVVLRLDVLARRTVVPLVLYGKAGLGATYWWITSGDNLARRNALSPSAPTNNTADYGQAAVGLSTTWHAAAGLQLRLDFLEPRAQRAWDLEMGVNHSYLFAEYMLTRDLNAQQLRVGSHAWTFGLAFEF